MNAPLIILSGPSGSGKTTFCYRLVKQFPQLHRIITYTTRTPRAGEVHGVDYWFVTPEQFHAMEAEQQFIETVTFGGNWYGVSIDLLERLQRGQACIATPDINGAKEIVPRVQKVTTIWLHVPIEIAEARLRARKTETEESIQKRIREARRESREVTESHIYQHTITVDVFGKAYQKVASVVQVALKKF